MGIAKNIRDAIDFCQKDEIGASGNMVRHGKFYVQKTKSTEFMLVSDWGVTFFCDHHGNMLRQSGTVNDVDEKPFGETTVKILEIIYFACSPIDARNKVSEAFPKNHPKASHSAGHAKARLLENEGLIMFVTYQPLSPNAPKLYGYALTDHGRSILRKYGQAEVK
jgi:hypothetical protein